MLVALDASQIISLSGTRSKTQGAREFLALWKRGKCELAINETTLREIVLRAGNRLDERRELLRELGPVRGLPHPNELYRVELITHVRAIARGETPRKSLLRELPVLRERFFAPMTTQSMEQSIEEVQEHAEKRREFDELSARGMEFARALGPMWPPRRLQAMTEKEAIAMARDDCEALPEPAKSEMFANRMAALQAFYRNPNDRRSFYIHSFGVKDMDVAREAPYEDFPELQFVRRQWDVLNLRRELSSSSAFGDVAHERSVLAALTPYALPGVSLRLAFLRQQNLDRSRKFKASDFPDAIALMFAPYTDLTCVDKRVAEAIRRERIGARRKLLASGAGDTLVDARSLRHVSIAIERKLNMSQSPE